VSEYEIVCVTKNLDGVITHVRLKNYVTLYPVQSIINSLTQDSFFTNHNGVRANVRSRHIQETGTTYLVTTPDGTTEDNLDYLPLCSP